MSTPITGKESIPIESLEVVGYATSLSEYMIPSIVPPVFRLKAAPDQIVFPPYHIYQGAVHGATISDQADFDAFVHYNKVVRLDEPVAAQNCFELWVDDQMRPHYEDQNKVEEKLNNFAHHAIMEAQKALQDGRLEHADKLAGQAMSANDQRIEPLAIKAAIRRWEGREEAAQVMVHLADRLCLPEVFEILINTFFNLVSLESSSLKEGDSWPFRLTRRYNGDTLLLRGCCIKVKQ